MTEMSRLVLEVDAKGVKTAGVALDSLAVSGGNAEKSTTSLTNATNTLANAAKAAAAAFGLYKLVAYAQEAALLSARFETMGIVMNIAGRNAGYTASQMEGFSKSLQKSGISMLQSRDALTQLATANIDLAQAAKLGRAAQDLAVVGNINSSDAMQRLIHGIKSGESMILRTMGLNVQFDAGYKRMALTLGTTTEKLTEQQKVLSRTETALEGAAKYTGIYEASMTTASKQLGSMTRYLEDLKVKIGSVFNETLTVAVMGFTDQLKLANKEVDTLAGNGSLKTWGDDVVDTFAFVVDAGISVVSVTKMIGATLGWMAARAGSRERGDTREQSKARSKAVDEAYTEDLERLRKGTSATRDALVTRRAALQEDVDKTKRIMADPSDRKFNTVPGPIDTKLAAAAEASKKAASEYKSAARAANDYITKLKEETQEIGLSGEQVSMLTAARAAAKAPTAALRLSIMALALAQLVATKADKEAALAQKERSDLMEEGFQAILKNKQAYDDARVAAQSYIDTISKQAARTVGGIGKGAAFRAEQGGLNVIEDKQTAKRQGLEGDLSRDQITKTQFDLYLGIVNDTYAKEVAIYHKSRDDIEAAQGEWSNGMNEALNNYFDSTQTFAAKTEDLVTKSFKGMEDALTSFVMTGKLDFKSLANSIIADMVRMMVQQSITGPLARMALTWMTGVPAANGAHFDGGASKFASGGTFTNQVVDQATPFRFASGGSFKPGVMGEAGPEAIMPLSRGPDGKLGVQASGQTAPNVTVIYNMTVGDVASASMVKQAIAGSERRIAAGIGRSMSYGGAMAA